MRGARIKLSMSIVEPHYFCYVLHVILFILQVVLFAMLWGHPERNFTVTFNDNVLTIGLSAFLQAFYTVYTTLLVFLMQRLTVLKFLSRPQNLTATHDVSGAWAGLGAAMTALWRQTNLAASTRATLSITIYLLCVFVLHVASSTVMGFESYMAITTVDVPANSIWPNTSVDLPTLNMDPATELMSIVSNFSGLSTDGLLNSTLYDTFNATSQMINASVNAHTIRANCGLLNLSYTFDNSSVTMNVSSTDGILYTFAPLPVEPLTFNEVTFFFMLENSTLIYVASTPMEINGSLGYLNVSLNPATIDSQYSNSSLVYFIACSLESYNYTSNLELQSGVLEPIVDQPHPPSQAWSLWSPPRNDSGAQLNFMVAAASFSPACATSACGNTLYYYLMTLLPTTQSNSTASNSSSISLTPYEFENALSHTVAQLLWIFGEFGEDGGGFASTETIAQVTEQIPRWRLNISTIPVIFTLSASFILMVIAFLMLGNPSNIAKDVPPVEGTTVLEMLWVGAHFSSLHKRLTAISYPSSKDLRFAGMFDACLTKSELAKESESAEAIPLLNLEIGTDVRFGDKTRAAIWMSKNRKSVQRSPRAVKSPYFWCYVPHGLFVLLHLVLLLLLVNHPEHSVIVESVSEVSMVLAVSLQFFYVVYTLLLVFITRRLAVSRSLVRMQNLTSVHDLSQAWTGLGTALVGVWQQIKVVASLRTTLAITTYYLCVSALHITSTTVMKFEAFESTRNLTAQSTLAWPTSGFGTYDWAALAPLVPLDQLPSLTINGLINNTIYDVPLVNSTSVNATVNATTIHANCGLLPTIVSSDGGFVNATVPTLGIIFTFDGPTLSFYIGQNEVIYINSPNSLNGSNSSWTCSKCDGDLVYLVTTTIDLDTSLGMGENLSITWEYTVPDQPSYTVIAYLVACSFNTTTNVDVLDVQNWVLAGTDLLASADAAQQSWSLWSPSGSSPGLGNLMSTALDVGIPTLSESLTNMDRYTMSLLGISNSSATINSFQFENAIAQIAAQYVWAAGHTNGDFGPEFGFGESIVTDLDIFWRLNINTIPAVIAFIASFVLFILAVYMVGTGPLRATSLSELGVLETLWLEAHSDVLHVRMRRVIDPTLDNLRTAGMFKICLGNEVRKALDGVGTNE